MDIRIAGIVRESFVDGPGIRFVVFAQGCSHGCEGCHNPDTHDFSGGDLKSVEEVFSEICSSKHIDGVTFSGGDPFFQSDQFGVLAERLKNKDFNIMAYTGFNFEDILNNEKMLNLLKNVDVLIDGPFVKGEITYSLPFRGSNNQRAIDVQESLRKGAVVLKKFD